MIFKRFLTTAEAARWFRVETRDIEHEIARGRLPSITIGTQSRIPRAALVRFASLRGPDRSLRYGLIKGLAIVCLVFGAGWLAASGGSNPFHQWVPDSIGPQQALYQDPDVGTVPDTWLPINSPLDYRRYNDTPNPEGTGLTHMLMSLQQRNDLEPGAWSFPWTLFVNLDTNHDAGDGVGTYVRLENRGNGWSSGYHVDSYAWGTGTTIGSNIETFDLGGQNPYLVGLNVQNKGFSGNVGMQVQTGPLDESHPLWLEGMDGGWEVGFRLQGMPGFGHFQTGIELDHHTWGQRGIWIRGDYQTGIDLGHNDLAMRAGARVRLADDAGIALRFNAQRDRIEFIQGDEVIGYLDAGLRNANLGG